jgi:hypothetical protein
MSPFAVAKATNFRKPKNQILKRAGTQPTQQIEAQAVKR